MGGCELVAEASVAADAGERNWGPIAGIRTRDLAGQLSRPGLPLDSA